ncbi:hypothetical protein T439DRAFT_321543 [Meredithblackwellia eburnea MCA 4105]
MLSFISSVLLFSVTVLAIPTPAQWGRRSPDQLVHKRQSSCVISDCSYFSESGGTLSVNYFGCTASYSSSGTWSGSSCICDLNVGEAFYTCSACVASGNSTLSTLPNAYSARTAFCSTSTSSSTVSADESTSTSSTSTGVSTSTSSGTPSTVTGPASSRPTSSTPTVSSTPGSVVTVPPSTIVETFTSGSQVVTRTSVRPGFVSAVSAVPSAKAASRAVRTVEAAPAKLWFAAAVVAVSFVWGLGW